MLNDSIIGFIRFYWFYYAVMIIFLTAREIVSYVVQLLIVFSCLLLVAPVRAATPVLLDVTKQYTLTHEVDYLLDVNHDITVAAIRGSDNWQSINRSTVNFGPIDAVLWLRLEVQAKTDDDWVLHVAYPQLDFIDNYSYLNGKPLPEVHSGDLRDFNKRPIDHANFAFPYALNTQDTLVVYLRVKTQGAAEVPIWLKSKKLFNKNNENRALVRGFINGIFIVMLLYNLFIYVSIRERVYLFYVLNVASCLVLLSIFDGTAFQMFWPNRPDLNLYAFPLCNGFLQITSLLFILEFLSVFKRNVWYRGYFKGLLVLVSLLPILALVLPYTLITMIGVLLALILNFSCLFLGIGLSIKGETSARYFTFAWTLFIVGLISSNLKGMGLLPTNVFTIYGSQIGSFVELVVLSLALAQRMEAVKNEKITAQRQNIQNLKRYKDLYSDSLSGHFQVSSQGQLVSVNAAYADIMGFESPQALMTSSSANKLGKLTLNLPTISSLFDGKFEKNKIQGYELQSHNKEGKELWLLLSLRVIRNEPGAIEYFEGSIIDISEQKELEHLREQSLKKQMITMQQLVVGISHEVNTPLGVVVTADTYLEQLIADIFIAFKNNEITRDSLENFLESGKNSIDLSNENLNKVTELMRHFKLVSISQSGYKYASAVFSEILQEAAEDLAEQLTGTQLTLSCEQTIRVRGYPNAVSDIVRQLIENSLVHGFDGTEKSSITILVEEIEGTIYLHYQDNGKGLCEQGLHDLFNPFYTTKRGIHGHVGLGMYQVFNIVNQLLQGSIEVNESPVGIKLALQFPSQIDIPDSHA